MNMTFKGYLHGLLSSASFGLIPFFSLPLMAQGMGFDIILFHRFLFAGLMVGGLLVARHQPLYVTLPELCTLAGLSGMYTTSAILLFWGYTYLSSGIATTIHFSYPVFVALFMTMLFHEKKSLLTLLAVLLACGGVALLSWGGEGGEKLSLFGIAIVLLSAVCNAVYITGMSRSRVRGLPGLRITLYVFLFGALIELCNTGLRGEFFVVTNHSELFRLAMLALVTAVISNLLLVSAVRLVGSTPAAVLGAMEPVTAVCVGIAVFHEPLTINLLAGMILIIAAVCLIVLSRPVTEALARRRAARAAE